MRALKGFIIAAVLCVTLPACAGRLPPNLTPGGRAAWYGTQAIAALDVVRDIAIAANRTTPPLMAEVDTRRVVLYHQSAIKVIHDTPEGWRPVIEAGLDETLKNLAKPQRDLLAPYADLVKAVLREIK